MAEQPKQQEPKVYFKCLPKDQVFVFLESFKKALAEAPNSDEKKNAEFEIKGTNEEPKGLCFELHNLGKEKYKEIFDPAQAHIQKALVICTLTFNAVDEASVKPLQELFEKIKNMFFPMIPFVKKHPENYELNLRVNGTKISVDLTSVKGEFLQPILDLGISFSDYHKIDAHYKSGFSPEDFFNLPVEEMILKAIQFAISFKSQSVGIRKIITAAIQALKTIKLTNAKFQKILDEHIENLNMLNSFISFVFSFEFDSKELCATGFKAVSETLLKGVDLNKKLEESRAKVLHFLKDVLKPMLDNFGGADAAKATNFDDISIAIAAPKYENGVIQNIHLPGLTKSFVSKMFE